MLLAGQNNSLHRLNPNKVIKFRFTIRWLLVLTALVAILTLRHKIVSDRERAFEKLTEDGVSLFHSWQKPFLHTVMVYDLSLIHI